MCFVASLDIYTATSEVVFEWSQRKGKATNYESCALFDRSIWPEAETLYIFVFDFGGAAMYACMGARMYSDYKRTHVREMMLSSVAVERILLNMRRPL